MLKNRVYYRELEFELHVAEFEVEFEWLYTHNH